MILRIKKEERWLAVAALVAFTLLNALLIYNHFDRFTRGAHVGFWTIFSNHLNLSGYDVATLIAISCLRVHYIVLRHPLFIGVLLPFYWLNHWLMGMTGFNFAMFFMAAVLIVCDVYGFIFLYRIFNELMKLRHADSLLLCAMFYSFAHVMLATIAPDHFAISLALLMGTLYLTGRRMQKGRMFKWWEATVLFFLTAGITLSNGVKTFIAVAAANGKRIFSWRFLAAFALPVVLLGGLVVWQDKAILEPQSRNIQKIEAAAAKPDPSQVERIKAHKEWAKRQNGVALADNVPLLEWSDITTSRWQSVVDNLFGESLQLHRDHLLEDALETRPVFVTYRSFVSYVVEALIVLLFVVGAWVARRNRLFQVVLLWFAFDMLMHLVFGFGINEVYIMTAHWAFIIPISIGFLLKKLPLRQAAAVRYVVAATTVWLLAYNLTILTQYFIA
jgi:hypothetical protein